MGVNGAQAVADMLAKVNKLEYLTLGMAESYFGDEGATVIAKSIVENLINLQYLALDFGFNDIKGFGIPEMLRVFSTVKYRFFDLSLSNNEFRDVDAKLFAPYFKRLVRTHDWFGLDFINTAITQKGKTDIERAFKWKSNRLNINNIPLVDDLKVKEDSITPEDLDLHGEVYSVDESKIHRSTDKRRSPTPESPKSEETKKKEAEAKRVAEEKKKDEAEAARVAAAEKKAAEEAARVAAE